MHTRYIYLFFLCSSRCSWAFRTEISKRALKSNPANKLSTSSCSGNVLYDAESGGPCIGFNTIGKVRHGLAEAWDKCADPNLLPISATFKAVGWGNSIRYHPSNAVLSEEDYEGQTVVLVLDITANDDPLTFVSEPVEEKAARTFAGFTLGYNQYKQKLLPLKFSVGMSSITKITKGQSQSTLTLRGVRSSDPYGEFQAVSGGAQLDSFLERLVACGTLDFYGLMPKRSVTDLTAKVITNSDLWLYGERHGQTIKSVDMADTDLPQITSPWALTALRIVPSSVYDSPHWLWGLPQKLSKTAGVPDQGDRGWPPTSRIGPTLQKFESDGYPCHLLGAEGVNQDGKPSFIALYMTLRTPDYSAVREGRTWSSNVIPVVIIKRGSGEDSELIKFTFSTSPVDGSKLDKYHTDVWEQLYLLDSLVSIQLPGGTKLIQEQCFILVQVNLKQERVQVKLSPHDNGKSMDDTETICNFEETIAGDDLTRFDVFGFTFSYD